MGIFHIDANRSRLKDIAHSASTRMAEVEEKPADELWFAIVRRVELNPLWISI